MNWKKPLRGKKGKRGVVVVRKRLQNVKGPLAGDKGLCTVVDGVGVTERMT